MHNDGGIFSFMNTFLILTFNSMYKVLLWYALIQNLFSTCIFMVIEELRVA